jgi:hypothetical protein
MSDFSARHALPFLMPAQAQKHVTHNEALTRLDLLVQLAVESFDALTPPATPLAGQIWALGDMPVGAWAGQGGRLAAWVDQGWDYVTPRTGMVACSGTDLRVFGPSGWTKPDIGPLQNLPGLGVNTSYDATNRLAVTAPATLLTHEGAGHQLKINKAAAADTASLLFQTAWGGRAEMGTTGNDDFALKVSANGADWHVAAQADAETGQLQLPNGAQVSAIAGTRLNIADVAGVARGGNMHLLAPSGTAAGGLWGAALSFGRPDGSTRRKSAIASVQTGADANHTGIAILTYDGTDTNAEALSPRLMVRHSGGVWANGEIVANWDGNAATPTGNAVFHTGNALGTVSQTAGVPTGALFQGNATSGSPTNGWFERRASGFLDCHHSLTTSTSAGTTWTFPSAFLSGTIPSIQITPVGAAPVTVSIDSAPTATSVLVSAWNAAGNRVAVTVHLYARGRWTNMS